MKTLYAIVIFAVLTAISTVAYTDQVPVNIVYPIKGEIYPKIDPYCPVGSSYQQLASFSVTCENGEVKWGMDGDTLGSATFYGQISVQFVWKLPPGQHVFWVDAGRCGKNEVKFTIK